MESEFKQHDGRTMPKNLWPQDPVDIKCRDGRIFCSTSAKEFRWSWKPEYPSRDIVGWRYAESYRP